MWLREDGGPYYVGKGKADRARASHPNHRPPKDKSRIIILDRSSESEAFETEKELIRNWGRKDLDTGCLINRTDGGDGASGNIRSEESKAKVAASLKGHPVSRRTRLKQSLAKIGKPHPHSDEQRRKVSIALTGRTVSEETREKLRDFNLGTKRSEETRRRMRESQQARRIRESQRIS